MEQQEEQFKSFHHYEVSNYGRVRRKLQNGVYKYTTGTSNPDKYKVFGLKVDGKHTIFKTHIVVAKLFLGDYPRNKEIDHIDRNKHNNKASNLRYVSARLNQQNKTNFCNHISYYNTNTGIKYRVQIYMGKGNQRHNKSFETKKEALSYVQNLKVDE